MMVPGALSAPCTWSPSGPASASSAGEGDWASAGRTKMPDEMAVLTSRPPPNMAAPTRTSRRVINGELRGCDRSRRWASANRTMWQWQARPPRACASLSLERQRLTRCRSAADFRVELPGGGKIGFAARAIAGQLLGAAAVIERPGVLRIDPDGGIEIRDRALIV